MIARMTRFFTAIAASSLLVGVFLQPLIVQAAQPFVITEAGPNIALDTTKTMTSGEWRLDTTLTPQANTNGTPANASLIFGYVDANNYYYANFSSASGNGLSGVYRVSNGARSTVTTYANTMTAGQTHHLEARHADGQIKLYLDTTYIKKVGSIAVNGTKIGVGTVAGNATVDSASLTTDSQVPLTLSFTGATTPDPEEPQPDPEPTPDPDPTPSPTPTGDFTITSTSPNGGIDLTASTAGASEWKLQSQITATAATGDVPANFSMVFGYVDQANYYYANFSERAANGLGGIYKITNGQTTKLLGHATLINPGQTYEMEVRYRDGDIRLYLNNTYIVKIEDLALAGTKVGVAALGSGAAFNDTLLEKSSSSTLNLTPTNLTMTPPTPAPGQSLPTPSNPVRTPSTGRQIDVSTSAELKAALAAAQPGDTITMADGTYTDSMQVGNYTGSFAITADGTAENPITLTGSPNAIIDGNGTGGRYGLYLAGADHWNLVGFTVANASKGVVQDGSNYVFYENMTVTNIGAEAIHFRAFSSHNVVKNSTISSTGRNSAQFGEGVYIGSASGANWDIHSGGQPDASDRNIVIGNTFTDFTAEAIDLKEGSTGNYVAYNTFEGSSLSGENSADSWVDIKGNYNLIEHNTGTNTLTNGFEVHSIDSAPGWASNNVFRNNTANINSGDYGFYISYSALQGNNIVECNNTVTGATIASWNVACTP